MESHKHLTCIIMHEKDAVLQLSAFIEGAKLVTQCYSNAHWITSAHRE